jgi:hypothetical protein
LTRGGFEMKQNKDVKRMVLIKWFDAKIYPGMHQFDEALNREMDMFESLGYLIERNDRATIMAHEVTEKGEYRDVLLIPSGSIISMQELVTRPPV